MTTLTAAPAPAQPLTLAQSSLLLAQEIGALASRLSALEAPRAPRK